MTIRAVIHHVTQFCQERRRWLAIAAASLVLPAAMLLALFMPRVLVRAQQPVLRGDPGKTLHPFRPSLRPDLEDPPPMHLPAKISECEASQCGVWEFSGHGGEAHWPSGAKATLTPERFGFDGVTVRRNDISGSTKGFVAVYTGKVYGNQLMGEVDWYWPGHWNHHIMGKWAATILEPADYNVIDPGIACDGKYGVSPEEGVERGVMAITAHRAQTGACWLRMSADAGNATAQGMLAALELRGIDVALNLSEAVRLAQQAAGQGSYLGERCLSLMYESGKGVEKDSGKASYWREKAERDRLAAVKVQQQEQDQLAQQQKEARGYQAQQAQRQHSAVAAAQQPRLNLQNLALLGMLLGGDDGNSGGGSRADINSLESQVQDAEHDCHAVGPGGSHAPAEKCDRYYRLKDELDEARSDYDAQTRELANTRQKLSAECKSGNKQSCQKLDQVNHELESR